MIIDIEYTGQYWLAVLPNSRITHEDPEMLEAIIRSYAYSVGSRRY